MNQPWDELRLVAFCEANWPRTDGSSTRCRFMAGHVGLHSAPGGIRWGTDKNTEEELALRIQQARNTATAAGGGVG